MMRILHHRTIPNPGRVSKYSTQHNNDEGTQNLTDQISDVEEKYFAVPIRKRKRQQIINK